MSTPLSYFQSIPWCADSLKHPDFRLHSSSESNPFREATKSNDTVKDRAFIYRASQNANGAESEGFMMMEVGYGISGRDGIAHGGFLATLMDEVTGGLIGALALDHGHGMRTASLNISYHKPLFARGYIIARAEVTKVERRKVWVKADIRDADGNICTTAEALFVMNRPSHC
ncbi:HotDog domain-containing protein [Aspergillus bertholletiae]|uniref:HotDog domain-containing protein n=1 Tax=Aspergillus bertholletiae TaxID=1226010 RepID=A0A5N7APY8_9EURO|nr:HotDog domain-containing protein [Aspergillus bertholletiae]